MLKKEKCIERYFNLWLSKDGSRLNEILDKNIIYSECYGPEYRGIEQIVKWFDDWNKRGSVIKWDIKQFIHQANQTVVKWYLECEFDGEVSGFDGVSVIGFNDDEKIIHIKEFQSQADHEFPYS